ncbi:MAG: aspartyl/asparaginyl beta-hydroxylase domain-containing protein [Candidatus Marinimicrobia bacterium]|nr:aspartyl/asparaginyl beta-hydroxylase domain-containing protein [Candidatus Neomarinimicrobiota bacterium]
MRGVQGSRLGRVLITRLAPGKSIAPHADGGAPAEYYERYQVALQSLPGCLFTVGDETVTFNAGDVWHIDNRMTHSVVNNSADDRVVMIVDIRVAP